MDLKLKDVADLLKVSKTTIRRWLAEGKIPAYRINNQYRFNRTEIEDWVMGQRLGNSPQPNTFQAPISRKQDDHRTNILSKQGTKQFNLFRAVHKGDVLHNVPGKTKEEVIRNSMQAVAKQLNLDADMIVELLLDREKMMPTALNNGFGVPHTRDFLIRGPHDVVIVAFPKERIDYGSLDNEPVHTLFFLLATDDKHHLNLLAKIAHLSNQDKIQEYLETQPSKENLLLFIKEWEGKIS